MGGVLIVSATYTPALESEHLRLVSIGVIEEYMYTVKPETYVSHLFCPVSMRILSLPVPTKYELVPRRVIALGLHPNTAITLSDK